MRESLTATTSNALRWRLAALAVEAKLVRARLALKVFNPFQPRVPAGTREGGQWAGDGTADRTGDGSLIQLVAGRERDRISGAELARDPYLNRHIVDGHVGKTDAEVIERVADSYRRQYDAARKQRGQRDPILPDDKNGGKGLTSPLAMMSWQEFAATAKLDPHHNFKRRMKLLREIQRLFASVERFSDLTVTEWKGIAGTLGKSERIAAGLDIHDWGWFGSMGGNGDFAGLISRQDRQLSDAVDCIPRKDPVTREDFEEYCRRFRKAFTDADAHHVGEFPTATRLLTMKRPDTFVCANGKNKGNLAEALNFAPTTLSLANYWDRIIVLT